MWLVVLLCHFGLILHCGAQTGLSVCSFDSTFRQPDNSDITVTCGTEYMYLSILLCPVYFGGYNESLMALNAKFQQSECHGTADWTVSPPVLKFNFSINENTINFCANTLEITNEIGSGQFSDFSNIQFVNISGLINSWDPSTTTITYRQELMYKFSCRYPLQYVVNNTEVSVSGVSLAVKDNNGSFISTLSMRLFTDEQYTQALQIPETGLQLKTRIFVQVKATNLTNRFNVLLDRCYATTSPIPSNSTSYDLFVGCNRDGQTVIEWNGVAQEAHFSFEAFRFVEHKNLSVSTFYLHCVTRLCENSTCASMIPSCPARRRREAPFADSPDATTVSAGPIKTRVDNGAPLTAEAQNSSVETRSNSSLVGVAVATGVLCVLCIAMATFIGILFKRRRILIH
ncbi:zona pellucida-like domain-containing protein 1 [Chanos chanos]|uniref:Zona pellucida-like domain-containing protein 1 n=1 Tax=Chanos chanos TaxID=29144 RepID=A0A6J2VPK4_CHACN|nr:zona pellucida-like domain-containing protein 1 [Chanos chanos]